MFVKVESADNGFRFIAVVKSGPIEMVFEQKEDESLLACANRALEELTHTFADEIPVLNRERLEKSDE